MMMLILGVGAAIMPFVPFVLKLVRFGGLVFRLKREKIAHEAVGEPFPVQYDHAIEQHTETVKRTGYKLLLVGTSVFALFCGAQWWVNNDLREQHLVEMKEKERMRALAVSERDAWYRSYTEGQRELVNLKARISEESVRREGLIQVDVKKRTAARKGRLDAEKKLPATSIDPTLWMRVESAQGSDAPATPASIPNAGSLPEGAG